MTLHNLTQRETMLVVCALSRLIDSVNDRESAMEISHLNERIVRRNLEMNGQTCQICVGVL